MQKKLPLTLCISTLLVPFLIAAEPARAEDNPAVPPAGAVVSMGDSYISGEGGRWYGNSDTTVYQENAKKEVTYAGTDRWGSRPNRISGVQKEAAAYMPNDPYNLEEGDTFKCHRAYNSEINSNPSDTPSGIGKNIGDFYTARGATRSENNAYNLACSGAVTKEVKRTAEGGEPQTPSKSTKKLKLTQADALQKLAAKVKVRLIVLNIGGNDLNFAGIISACIQKYVTTDILGGCKSTQQAAVNKAISGVMENIQGAIVSIQNAMAAVKDDKGTPLYGLSPADGKYRIILQAPPGPLPNGNEIRAEVQERGKLYDRGAAGCPIGTDDMTWAKEELGPQIARNLRLLATDQRVDFLDMSKAFDGHEVCARKTKLYSYDSGVLPPDDNGKDAEWMRYADLGAKEALLAAINIRHGVQGDFEESFHPNAFGQRAMNACLQRTWDAITRDAHSWPRRERAFFYRPVDYYCASPGEGQPPSQVQVNSGLSTGDHGRSGAFDEVAYVTPPSRSLLITAASGHGKCLADTNTFKYCGDYGTYYPTETWNYDKNGKLQNAGAKCFRDVFLCDTEGTQWLLRSDRKIERVRLNNLTTKKGAAWVHSCLYANDGTGGLMSCDGDIKRMALWSSLIEIRERDTKQCLYGEGYEKDPLLWNCAGQDNYTSDHKTAHVLAWFPSKTRADAGFITDSYYDEDATRNCLTSDGKTEKCQGLASVTSNAGEWYLSGNGNVVAADNKGWLSSLSNNTKEDGIKIGRHVAAQTQSSPLLWFEVNGNHDWNGHLASNINPWWLLPEEKNAATNAQGKN
ncbi:hypothetical protein ACFWIB_42250 [Streptomyces sp. NPDC127051]|uniref:hypothetical protein n=1 Tax=Streptomyces sp. NPDC127051 TaxID=3347119 RepID=UPI003659F6AD